MAESRPRILFVGPMLGGHPGWVPNPAELLAPRLVERGWTCRLTSSKINRLARLAETLATILSQRESYDIVSLQVYSGPGFIVDDLASWLACRLQKPVVMVLHGGGLPEFIHRHPRWTARVFKRAAQIVTPSGYLRQTVEQMGRFARVIPNALDLGDYPFRQRERAAPRMLWMRTFHPLYNPQMAVEALAVLSQAHPDALLTMAGQDRGELQTVRLLAERLGVSSKIRFAGFLDTPAKQREFSSHDIYLHTNNIDNMPVSIIEAAAFGLPVVATAVGGVPYLIGDGENGRLVPAGDGSSMAAAVEQILSNPSLAQKFSSQGRSRVEPMDWSCVLPQWETVFQETAAKRQTKI